MFPQHGYNLVSLKIVFGYLELQYCTGKLWGKFENFNAGILTGGNYKTYNIDLTPSSNLLRSSVLDTIPPPQNQYLMKIASFT